MKIQQLQDIQDKRVTFAPAHLEEPQTVTARAVPTPGNSSKDLRANTVYSQTQALPSHLRIKAQTLIKWVLAHQNSMLQVTSEGHLKTEGVVLPNTSLAKVIQSVLQSSSLQLGEILVLRMLKKAPLQLVQLIPTNKWTLVSKYKL